MFIVVSKRKQSGSDTLVSMWSIEVSNEVRCVSWIERLKRPATMLTSWLGSVSKMNEGYGVCDIDAFAKAVCGVTCEMGTSSIMAEDVLPYCDFCRVKIEVTACRDTYLRLNIPIPSLSR